MLTLLALFLSAVLCEPVELVEATKVPVIPSAYGSFTVEELYDYMQHSHRQNPAFSDYGQFGKSLEQRSMQLMCLGRCGDDDTAHIAQSLFTGMHHSREPGSMMSLVYFIDLVMSSVTKVARSENPDKYYEFLNLLHTRQIWLIPLVNVDGYAYNLDILTKDAESSNFAHVPMQRKNRRDTCSKDTSQSGVDLNRNYDVCFSLDDSGSSPDPCAEDYRGESPFSEPETKLMHLFMLQHNITTSINYHSYGSDIVIPFSCKHLQEEQRDNDKAKLMTFVENLAARLKAKSGGHKYVAGRSYEKALDLYPVNGDSADYMLNQFGTAALTVEVGALGNHGFWPDFAKDDLTQELKRVSDETLQMTLESAWSSGPYFHIDGLSVASSHKAICFAMVAVNKGMWRSFGPQVTVTLAIPNPAKLNEPAVFDRYAFKEDRMLGKLEAMGGNRHLDFCLEEKQYQFVDKQLNNPDNIMVQVIVSDAAHCVVYEANVRGFAAQIAVTEFKELDTSLAKRSDPGFGACTLVDKIEELYFDRPGKQDLVVNYTLPTRKKIHKIWETDPPTAPPTSPPVMNDKTLLEQEKAKLENFKYYSGIFFLATTGIVLGLGFVFFGLKVKDRVEEYRYEQVEEDDESDFGL